MLFGVNIIIIIIEGLSLLQSIPPTTADKQTIDDDDEYLINY